jgi:dipeptidyl aminopeptidase/acylaminoacyl peptidase
MSEMLIPRRVLFGNPQNLSPRLSPDGNKLALVAPDEGVLNLWIRSLEDIEAQVITQDRDRGIRNYFWSRDGKQLLYLQDRGGNENWRLYGVDITTQKVSDYTPFENVQVQILHQDKHFPDELIIALNLDNPQAHDVYQLHLPTATLTKIANNPGNILGWVPDAQLNIRAAVAAQPDGSMSLLYRKTPTDDWKTLRSWGMADSLNSSPSHFSRDGNTLYLLDSQGANTSRLIALNVETGQEQVLAEDPHFDAGHLMIHPDTYEIQALTFVRAREEWQVLDSSIVADMQALASLCPGDFTPISRDDADQNWLVQYDQDNGPVHYYVYHRPTQTGKALFVHQPALLDYQLAPMEPITVTARDGLTLHGYATFPRGLERENLPMVVNVHGGPWWRDTWGYHPEAQWLANRGYVCLQLNYRGSTGYGKDFLNAGDREWGGKMHLDLIDAIEYMISQGWVDRDRIGIYGGSYGGYAALVGATFTPHVFRCAIDMVGPSSLITLIQSFPPYWAAMLDNFKRRVGDPDTESEFLKSRSPLFHVDQIQVPLLIAQGANDPRVTVIEAEQIVGALKEKGIAHEYMLFPDEGHGLAKPENRMQFYAAVERFLQNHLGGLCELS